MPSLRFLLVEHNASDVVAIQRTLTESGIDCELLNATNREDYLAKVERDRVDVILCSDALPDCNSIAALDIAQALQPEVPFIFVSASFGEDSIEALKRGATDYVMKDRLVRLVPCVQRALREVRARRESNRALQASEAKYRQLFESIAQCFCRCEMFFDDQGKPFDYRFLEANRRFEQMTGLQNPVGKTARELVPNLEAHWFETYGRVVRTGEPTWFENQSIALNRWYEVNAIPIGDPYPNQFALLFMDISDRKRAEAERNQVEQALRASEEQVRNILESITDAFFAVDPDWRFTYVNQTAYQLVNRTPGDLIGKNVWQEFPGLNHSGFEQMHRRVMRDRVAEALTAFYPDDDRWYTVHTYPAADGGVTMYFRDLTEEIRIKEDRDRFFQLSQDMLAIVNTEGYFLQANHAWTETLGYTTEELTAQPYLEFVHPDDRDATVQEAASLAQGVPTLTFENRYRCRDGSYRWIAWSVAPFVEQRLLYCVAKDVTERKQAEAEREHYVEQSYRLLQREQAARKEAETANRLKDEFLAVLSHELRTPLNPILGWLRLLNSGKLDSTRQAEALKVIDRNAQLQAKLVEDLLDISRIMQGKFSLSTVPLNLSTVIAAAVETVRLNAEAKHIQIHLNLDPNGAAVSGDAARLQQVIWNLLSNAVKFTPPGGQVWIELRQREGTAQLRVSDTGKGIDAAFLPHIFEYFRQEDSSITRKFGGLGLGLAIARQLIELHGGTIRASSNGTDQGATFTVELPVLLHPEQQNAAVSDPLETNLPLTQFKILLVEDDADAREFQSFMLEQGGASVTAVASGQAALQVLEQETPTLLVCDIGMADMDGYQLMQQVRSRFSAEQLPAVALTAFAGDGDRGAAIAAGFQQHVVKPVDPEELIRVIVALVEHPASVEQAAIAT